MKIKAQSICYSFWFMYYVDVLKHAKLLPNLEYSLNIERYSINDLKYYK